MSLFGALELTLSVVPRYVSVFCSTVSPPRLLTSTSVLTQHMLDLPPHGQNDQNEPVENKHWPEDGQVEDLAPGTAESKYDGARGRVPEFELGQSAHKGLEFFVRLGRQMRAAFFHALVLFQRGIEFRADEGEEEVKEVDTERVCDWEGGVSLAFVLIS